MNPALTLTAAILIPLAGAVLIGLFRARPNIRETVTLVTATLLFLDVMTLLPAVLGGGRPMTVLVKTVPGLRIALMAEPLGMMFAALASFLWIVTSIYSIGYMRGHQEENQTRFYICFAIALASAMGVALAANMFTLFIFYEALTLSTYPLVTHHGTDEAKRAGRVYLSILLGTSIGLQLIAIIWTWMIAGTLDFRTGGIIAGKVEGPAVALLLALYAFGIGKAALMPFHPLATGGDGGADAGQRAPSRGCRGQGRGLFHCQGTGLYLRHRLPVGERRRRLAGLHCRRHHPDRLGDRAAPGQFEVPAGLFHCEPALLRGDGGGAFGSGVGDGGGAAHRRACVRQDHAVLRRGFDPGRLPQDRGQPAQRHRPVHAVDHGRRSPSLQSR